MPHHHSFVSPGRLWSRSRVAVLALCTAAMLGGCGGEDCDQEWNEHTFDQRQRGTVTTPAELGLDPDSLELSLENQSNTNELPTQMVTLSIWVDGVGSDQPSHLRILLYLSQVGQTVSLPDESATYTEFGGEQPRIVEGQMTLLRLDDENIEASFELVLQTAASHRIELRDGFWAMNNIRTEHQCWNI